MKAKTVFVDGPMRIVQNENGDYHLRIYGEDGHIIWSTENKPNDRCHPCKWISVNDRLPETDDYVLVTCLTKKGVRSVIRAYYDGEWRGNTMSQVIAWMPMPEPYEP